MMIGALRNHLPSCLRRLFSPPTTEITERTTAYFLAKAAQVPRRTPEELARFIDRMALAEEEGLKKTTSSCFRKQLK